MIKSAMPASQKIALELLGSNAAARRDWARPPSAHANILAFIALFAPGAKRPIAIRDKSHPTCPILTGREQAGKNAAATRLTICAAWRRKQTHKSCTLLAAPGHKL